MKCMPLGPSHHQYIAHPLLTAERTYISASPTLADLYSIPLALPTEDQNLEDYGYIWDEKSPVEQVRPCGKDSDGRGEKSIHILGLDRAELTSEQSRGLLALAAIVEKFYAGEHFGKPLLRKNSIADIQKLTAPQNEFAGLKRAFFRARGLGNFVSQDR